MSYVLLIPAIHLLSTISTLVQWVVARAWGIVVHTFGCGVGPVLLSFRLRGVAIRLGAIPLGSYIQMVDDPTGNDIPVPPGTPMVRDLGLGQRIVLLCAGVALLLGLAAAQLGVAAMWAELVSGFGEILRGALAPVDVGRRWILAAVEAGADRPRQTVALLAVKVAAFNLLPLTPLSGGATLMLVAQRLNLLAEDDPGTVESTLDCLGLLIMLGLVGGWLIALGAALLNG